MEIGFPLKCEFFGNPITNVESIVGMGMGSDVDRDVNNPIPTGNNSHRYNKQFDVSVQQYTEMTTEL